MVLENLNVTCSCPYFEKCWTEDCVYRLITPFRTIAEDLFDRYKQAKLASITKNGKLRISFSGYRKQKRTRKVEASDMVYLVRSRDFCVPSVRQPSKYPGTRGRECSVWFRSNLENLAEFNPEITLRYNVCDNLCCGRGYFIKVMNKQLNCSCRFSISKVTVVCKKCTIAAVYYICN